MDTTTNNAQPVGYIDITPTWSDVLGLMLMVLESGTPEGKREVREEFKRMAEAADRWNARDKG